MAKKPAKYGLKVYALCDSKIFYMQDIEMCSGVQKPGPFECSNKPFDVVTRLNDTITKTNQLKPDNRQLL